MSHFVCAHGGLFGLGPGGESVCAPASSDLPDGEGGGAPLQRLPSGPSCFLPLFYSHPLPVCIYGPSGSVQQGWSLRAGLLSICSTCVSCTEPALPEPLHPCLCDGDGLWEQPWLSRDIAFGFN